MGFAEHFGHSFLESLKSYTANILGAKTAALSCVTRPAALWMHSRQLLAAVYFSC